MFSLKNVGLIIKADGTDVPIHHFQDGHYGPVWKTVPGRVVTDFGPRSRGLDPRLATDAR